MCLGRNTIRGGGLLLIQGGDYMYYYYYYSIYYFSISVILVPPQQAHHQLAGVAVVPLHAGDLQGVQQHPRQPEGDPLLGRTERGMLQRGT